MRTGSAERASAAVDTLPATTRFASYRLTHEGLPTALVVDSPGLTDTDRLDSLVQAADDCDMILWVNSAARAAHQDQRSRSCCHSRALRRRT